MSDSAIFYQDCPNCFDSIQLLPNASLNHYQTYILYNALKINLYERLLPALTTSPEYDYDPSSIGLLLLVMFITILTILLSGTLRLDNRYMSKPSISSVAGTAITLTLLLAGCDYGVGADEEVELTLLGQTIIRLALIVTYLAYCTSRNLPTPAGPPARPKRPLDLRYIVTGLRAGDPLPKTPSPRKDSYCSTASTCVDSSASPVDFEADTRSPVGDGVGGAQEGEVCGDQAEEGALMLGKRFAAATGTVLPEGMPRIGGGSDVEGWMSAMDEYLKLRGW